METTTPSVCPDVCLCHLCIVSWTCVIRQKNFNLFFFAEYPVPAVGIFIPEGVPIVSRESIMKLRELFLR